MKSMVIGWRQMLAYVNTYDLFQFSAVRNITFKGDVFSASLIWSSQFVIINFVIYLQI